jgi:hypothetical protein
VFDVSMVSHIDMVSQATQICQWMLPGQNWDKGSSAPR